MIGASILNTLLFIAAFMNIAIGFLVVFRNHKEKLNKAFFALSVAIAGWSITNVLFQLLAESQARYHIALASYGFASVLAICFYIFGIALTEHAHKEASVLKRLLIAFASIMGALSVLPGIVATGVEGSEILTNRATLGIYGFSVVALLVRGAWLLLKARRRYTAQEKSRDGVIIISFLAALCIGVIFNLILPIRGNYDLVAVGPTGSLLFVTGTAYAIAKHRLFDIRLIVARSIAYIASLIALAGLYGFGLFVLAEVIFNVDISLKVEVALSILTAFVALTFDRTRRFFARQTNQLFYQDAYDAQEFFNSVNQLLVSSIDIDKIVSGVLSVIDTTLRPDFCAIVFYEKSKPQIRGAGNAPASLAVDAGALPHLLPAHSEALVVTDYLGSDRELLKRHLSAASFAIVAPIGGRDGAESNHVSYLILGPKKSGNIYNAQDIQVITALSNEMVIAIQNALRFQEIKNFNITLQEKVDEATKKLRRTNDRLRTLDQTKDDFISMASHQLRTPLTSVKGYVSMVLDGDAGKITGLQRKLLTQSFISSQRMVYLISDLLNVSRLRTGKFVIEAVPTDLARVIEEEVEQLIETAKGRGLALTYHKPEHFPPLMLDETKLRQVIMNFIDNAVYYTPSGGHIDIYLTDKPQTIEFTVMDDGIGVPKAEQHHLFSKFYRAHNAKRARPDGTGLGIFMAKKVIIAQGGAVIFRSTEGKGSTFGFTFPKRNLLPSETIK